MSNIGNKEIFAKNLNYYMYQKGKTRMDLSKDLDIAYTTVTDWVTGAKYPRIDKIEKLAVYFGVSKSHLVEDYDLNSSNGIEDAMIISKYHKLNEANKSVIKSTLDALLQAQEM